MRQPLEFVSNLPYEIDYRADRIGTAMAWGLRSQVRIFPDKKNSLASVR